VSKSERPSVLVVDDDDDIAQSIGDVLRAGGYRYELVADGSSALEIAASKSIGLVLLDWRLPDEPHGAQLVRKLRDACGPNVPVVVLSADPISLNEARDANVTDYLPKPFEIDDLLDLVDQYSKG
jgi:two-component system response regulator MtrA